MSRFRRERKWLDVAGLDWGVREVARIKGEFIWHQHENEDELFYLLKGAMQIRVRNQEPLVLREGDMTILPKGVEHKPVTDAEAWIVMIGPKNDDKHRQQGGQ